MRIFLSKAGTERDPLAVTMSGVRRGERVLQVGLDDPAIACAIAQKSGLTGHAVLVVANAADAAKAQAGVEAAGVLLDIRTAPFQTLPFEDASVDAAIVHNVSGCIDSSGAANGSALRELHRIVRSGGRIIVMERGTPTGFFARLRFGSRPAGGAEKEGMDGGTLKALERAGFRPARVLADSEGCRFIEGFRR